MHTRSQHSVRPGPVQLGKAHWGRRGFVTATLIALLAASTLVGCQPQPWAATAVNMTVLVLDDGSEMVAAIADRLAEEGVPTRVVDLTSSSRPTLTASFLGSADEMTSTANYMGVVVPNESPAALSEQERATLAAYERAFGVREVVAYTWASPAVGLNYASSPGYTGPVDGMQATVTSEGLTGAWNYLRGTLSLDDVDASVDESYGYLATPLANDPTGGSFHPLVTATIPGTDVAGSLIGEYDHDGREQLVSTFASNGDQTHFKVLAHGIVTWLTRGVSTSLYRNLFSVQVDDIFLPDDRWSIDGNCTIGDGCDPHEYPSEVPGASIRMGGADVDAAVAWQNQHGFDLNLVFNGGGSVEAGTGDPLTDRFLANRAAFRWTNHTYEHLYLGCIEDYSTTPWHCATANGIIQYASPETISHDVNTNLSWAQTVGLPVDATELVTGEHSGLKSLPQMPVDNPNLAPVLDASGIKWVASDASREPASRPLGQARTVPRHPTNIYYNTATKAEAVDEYNWVYTRRADGGSGACEDHPDISTCITPLPLTTGFDDYIVPIERRIAFGHVVDMDPSPHYAHQSNLAEDRVLYPVLDGVLATYRNTFSTNAPIVNPRLGQAGTEMVRRQTWAQAQGVLGVISGDRVTVLNTGTSAAEVPLTMPTGTRLANGDQAGEAYAGQDSQWFSVAPGAGVAVTLPTPAGFRRPPSWPEDAPVGGPALAPPIPGAVVSGPTTVSLALNDASLAPAASS